MFLASACLVGLCTRYDGNTNTDPEVLRLFKEGKVIPVCPEQLGGLPTPREPVEFDGGDARKVYKGEAKLVGVESGVDRTENFKRGAEEVLKIAKLLEVEGVYLMDRSPSCGVNSVYVNGKLAHGMGMTAFLLAKAGFKLIPRSPEGEICQERNL